MRTAAASFIALALVAGSADAQTWGRNQAAARGIPPGQAPGPGECRVWYNGVPPGRQPRPTSCREAERIAARDRNARVIYGDDYYYGGRGGNTVTGAMRDRIQGNRSNGAYHVAYDNGYRDGLDKGREDRNDRDSFDPVRHSRYRSADEGYNSRFGSKEQYKLVYRDGFEAGYAQGYGRRYR
jgi:hypothetical protein